MLVKEAGCSEKLVVTMMGRCTVTGWDVKEKRLAQLKELKHIRGDMAFVLGQSPFWYDYDDELRRKVEECVEELNSMKA